MMLTVRIIAFLHMIVYLGIIWYGWQSFRYLKNRSWLYLGLGFMLLLTYRADRFVVLIGADYDALDGTSAYSIIIAFMGALLLLLGFIRIARENKVLITALANAPIGLRAGAQTTDYWLEHFRQIVKEEVALLRESK
jgi:hypothetical protein